MIGVVCPRWLRACARLGAVPPSAAAAEAGAAAAGEDYFGLRLLEGLAISVSGAPEESRAGIRQLLKRHGGTFHAGCARPPPPPRTRADHSSGTQATPSAREALVLIAPRRHCAMLQSCFLFLCCRFCAG